MQADLISPREQSTLESLRFLLLLSICDVLLYLAKRHFFSQASGLPPALDTFESCSTTFILSVQRVACSGWHCFNDSCVFISLFKLSSQVFSSNFWEAVMNCLWQATYILIGSWLGTVLQVCLLFQNFTKEFL